MTHLSMAGPGGVGTTARSRSLLVGAAAGAAVATLVNAALWAGGLAADASFLVTLPTGDTVQVGIVEVVLKTVLAFAVGTVLLALAARRSHRWVRAVLVAAVLVAVLTTGGPLSNAHDIATGVLLAAMHLVTGGTFVVTASRVATTPA
jgi:hypothetical protein